MRPFRFPRFFVVVLLGTACAFAPGLAASTATPAAPIPTPTSAAPITRERAIDIAMQVCWHFHLALIGEPRNIRAQLTTIDESNKLANLNGGYPYDNLPLSTLVWLVQIDGQAQIRGSVMPTPGGRGPVPTPVPFEVTCAVSIDANTGFVIGLSEHSL